MGDPARSPAIDLYGILGIPKSANLKEMCKAYKSLVSKWQPDKNPSNKHESQLKFQQINDAYKALNERKIEESPVRNDYESTKKTPKDLPSSGASSHRYKTMDESFFSRTSVLLTSPLQKFRESSPGRMRLSKNSSRRSPSPAPDSSRSKSTGRRSKSRTSSPSPNHSSKASGRTGSQDSSRSKSTGRRSSSETEIPSLLRNPTKTTNTTPIVYSQSTAWRIPSAIERKLECTLEELCHGGVKKINITRDAISNGMIKQVEEVLKIIVKPGWKKGTEIRFEGKGDEKPGYLPADIVFLIDEKPHPLFTRKGDDLEYGLEIPLVQALTGCSISVPLLGGEHMRLSFDEIIYPGFEKVIPGQGMPTKTEGKRGDLRIRFFVEFPSELSSEQRNEASGILQDCS